VVHEPSGQATAIGIREPENAYVVFESNATLENLAR
jgi:hypothetical protein